MCQINMSSHMERSMRRIQILALERVDIFPHCHYVCVFAGIGVSGIGYRVSRYHGITLSAGAAADYAKRKTLETFDRCQHDR